MIEDTEDTSNMMVRKELVRAGSMRRAGSQKSGSFNNGQQSDAFTQLNQKFAKNLDEVGPDDVSLEQIVVMQQDVIRDFEERLVFVDNENSQLRGERDDVS